VTLRWFLGCTAAATAIGWLSALIDLGGWAPVGLLSLAVGVGLGLCVAKLATVFEVTCRRRLVAGTLLFALVTVFSEHAWLYRDFRRQWQAERDANPQVAMFRSTEPWSPAEYFQREASPTRTALWCLDAALIAIGAVTVVAIASKKFVVADDANQSLTSDL
jgi:hypothetical protein